MKRNITQIRKILTERFPDLEFSFDTHGRGYMKGRRVTWTGGPNANVVQAACGPCTIRHFHREMTPDERTAWLEDQDRKHAAWMAGEPARRAARKADGLAKAKATRARRQALAARFTALWPDTPIRIEATPYGERFAWVDGPSVDDFVLAVGCSQWVCTRTETPEAKAAIIAANRLSRRLERAKTRAALLPRALHRRRCAYAVVAARATRQSAQYSLAF